MLLQLAIGLIIAYGGIVGVMYFAQRSLMYLPDIARVSPAAAGLPRAEEITLTTADSERLVVWHVAPRTDSPVILYFQGNGGNLRHRANRFDRLVQDGFGYGCRIIPWFRRLNRITERGGASARRRRSVCLLHRTLRRRAHSGVGRFVRDRRGGRAGEQTTGRASDPGGAVHFGGRDRGAELSAYPGQSSDEGPVPLGCADRRDHGANLGAARRARPRRSDRLRGASLTQQPRPKRFVRFADGEHEGLDVHGAIAAVREFLAAAPADLN